MLNRIVMSGRTARVLATLVAGVLALAMAGPVAAVDTGGGGAASSGSAAKGSMASPAVAVPAGRTAKPRLLDLDAARQLIARSDWPGSIKLLRQIAVQQPRNADALNLLGYSLRQHGEMKEAEGWYLKALRLQPSHLGANEYLGELYVLTGQMQKAKARLAAIQKICGNTACDEYKDLAKAIAAKA